MADRPTAPGGKCPRCDDLLYFLLAGFGQPTHFFCKRCGGFRN
jgi:hypothetical protein